jgi:hypothetical protein
VGPGGERLARLRIASQRLHRPAARADPVEIARSMAGAQAQEKRAGLLQFRARSRGLTAASVERARVEERSLIRGWLMRRTVHLVAAEDYRWMLALWSERHARHARRRLAQLGIPTAQQERALRVIEKALGEAEDVSRPELVERLASAGIALKAETRLHMIFLAVVAGLACIGPDRGGSGSLVLAREWLGPGASRDREQSLAELARRYLGAFAPATDRDFAYWAGLPLGDCRVGLERIGGGLVVLGDGLLALRSSRPRAPRAPVVRLLGGFDTYLMGYASRAHAVDEADERWILPGGGVLRPTICVDGRLVGPWRSKRSGKRLAVALEPFEPLSDETHRAIAAEVEDIGRFEGLTATLG